MKHTLIYIAAALLILGACAKEKESEHENISSREQIALEVSYTDAAGEPVSALSFNHKSVRQALEVKVNSENLRWNLESNADWCHVVQEQHRGSGTVLLDIDLNEDFEDRTPATLTFVAGEYRGFQIQVNQSAAAFVVAQPYFVAPLKGGSYTARVVTLKGTDWYWENDDWISVSKVSQPSTAEYDITDLTLTVDMDYDSSRYGSVVLKSGQEEDAIYLWQFGTEMGYDSKGNLFFGSGERALLKFKSPAYCVKDVLLPEYGSAEITQNQDNTATIAISLKENLSDCAENREAEIKLVVNNSSATQIELPTIIQEYSPANGLMTGPGLVAFANAVAKGEPTTDWERNGVVTVLQDINMAEIEGWTGIGSATMPFTGTFDGGGFAVTNLTGTGAGIFNYCKDATIKDIRLGKGSSIYENGEYVGKAYFGGIVSYAENTTISGCSMAASMEFSGDTDDEAFVYAGGIAGWCDKASRIQACRVLDQGKFIVTSPNAADVTFYTGGIAGLCLGEVSASEMSGEFRFSSSGTVLLGGIESTLVSDASVSNNAFNGSIVLAGSASYAAVGGLYGTAETDRTFDSASDRSVAMGSLQVESYATDESTLVYMGGFLGFAQPETNLSFKGYNMQNSFKLDQSQSLTLRYLCVGGVLGGCDHADSAASLTFENLTNSGAITMLYGTAASRMRHGLFGGIAGFINGPATVVSCTNNGAVGVADPSGNARCGATSNDYNEIIGGIVGYADGGNLSITSCINAAALANLHYSNRPSTSSYDDMFCAQVAGGILGAFHYVESASKYTLTIKDCINSEKGLVQCFRGYAGGVVGFCQNATIENSSSSGGQAATSYDNAYYRGGIAGGIVKGTIKDCWANCAITSGAGGSAEAAFSGGIIGWVKGSDKVTVESCKYTGRLNAAKSGEKPIYPGGIIGAASDNTEIKDCKFGGSVQGTDITANNASTPKLAVGNVDDVACTISGLGYWDGKN